MYRKDDCKVFPSFGNHINTTVEPLTSNPSWDQAVVRTLQIVRGEKKKPLTSRTSATFVEKRCIKHSDYSHAERALNINRVKHGCRNHDPSSPATACAKNLSRIAIVSSVVVLYVATSIKARLIVVLCWLLRCTPLFSR